MPSFTFVSTVNAFVLRGARPVFVDVRPDTLNLDERQLERADHAAHEGDRPGALRRRRLRDGRDPRDRRARTASRSSRTTRTASSAGTAAAARHVRRARDAELPRDEELHLRRGRRAPDQRRAVRRARRDPAREGHQPQPLLPRGRSTSTPGSTSARAICRPTCSPRSCSRSSRRARRSKRRREIWERYARELAALGARRGVALPDRSGALRAAVPHVLHADASSAQREALIQHLDRRSILAVFHYLPLHVSDMGRRFAGPVRALPGERGRFRTRSLHAFLQKIMNPEQGEVIDVEKNFKGV